MRFRLSFIFFFMDVNCWTEFVEKSYHSFIELLLHLCKKSVVHICVYEYPSSLFCCIDLRASLIAQPVKIPPAMQEKEGTPSIFSEKKKSHTVPFLLHSVLWGNHRAPTNFKGRGNRVYLLRGCGKGFEELVRPDILLWPFLRIHSTTAEACHG